MSCPSVSHTGDVLGFPDASTYFPSQVVSFGDEPDTYIVKFVVGLLAGLPFSLLVTRNVEVPTEVSVGAVGVAASEYVVLAVEVELTNPSESRSFMV